jgi:L-asparaginase
MSPDSKGMGTLVVMNDTINSSMEVTKTHTMSLDTFKSVEFGPLGMVDHNEVIYYRNLTHPFTHKLGNHVNNDTYLLKAYAGIDGSILEFLIQKEAKGIVIESLGRGNLPPMMIPAINKAIEQGIIIVITSRCYSGRVLDTYAYSGGGKDLTKRGCKLGGNLNGQKARILLMLAISNHYTDQEIDDLFDL